ncbi:O-methyltransferase, partial [Sphingomonas sp.]|uniref:O-methyltransferase n=1 Tax=Sphingomonas sp. TaxID=28214 RepID=UPI001D6E13BD
MTDWARVDDYIAGRLLGEDAVLAAALAANAAAGLPPIDVSATQGKMLHLFARSMNARRILEIGTLGGYSTIWLARALGAGGALVTLELEPHHADVARANIARAGLADRVTIHVGAALDSLAALPRTPFDLVFIDADKENGANYVRAALDGLTRPGSVIIVDNVVREGAVIDPADPDPRVIGTRALFDYVSAEPRLTATAVQTVGAKKWDG